MSRSANNSRDVIHTGTLKGIASVICKGNRELDERAKGILRNIEWQDLNSLIHTIAETIKTSETWMSFNPEMGTQTFKKKDFGDHLRMQWTIDAPPFYYQLHEVVDEFISHGIQVSDKVALINIRNHQPQHHNWAIDIQHIAPSPTPTEATSNTDTASEEQEVGCEGAREWIMEVCDLAQYNNSYEPYYTHPPLQGDQQQIPTDADWLDLANLLLSPEFE